MAVPASLIRVTGPTLGAARWVLDSPRHVKIGALLLLPFLVMAAVPGLVAPYDPLHLVGPPLDGPSLEHLLGTDEVGRDVLSRVIFAARSDIVVSLASTAIAFALGSTVGLLFGYVGGRVDTVAMRAVDILLAFPTIVLALFLIAVFGSGRLDVETFAIAIVMMPSMARLSRGTGVVLRRRSFVEASILLKAPTAHIVWRHLLPNAMPTLLVAASALAAGSVLIAASLSYLGLGVQPPTPSWGNLFKAAYNVVFTAPLYGLAPGLCVTVVAYAYTELSRGLRERYGRGEARRDQVGHL